MLREKWDVVNALTKEMVVVALTLFEEVGRLEKSLKKTNNTIDKLEDKVSILKDEVVSNYVHHFERTGRQATFLYPDMDLSNGSLLGGLKCSTSGQGVAPRVFRFCGSIPLFVI